MKVGTDPKPLRIPLPKAAKLLDITPDWLRRLANAGVFTVVRPNGAGGGKRMYLLPAEVEAFATGGVDAVAKLRKKHPASK